MAIRWEFGTVVQTNEPERWEFGTMYPYYDETGATPPTPPRGGGRRPLTTHGRRYVSSRGQRR